MKQLKSKLKLRKDDPILKEFTCSIKNRLNVSDVYGRFLVSEKHLIFASQLFGASASIIQPLSDVFDITTNEKKLILKLSSKAKVRTKQNLKILKSKFFFSKVHFLF